MAETIYVPQSNQGDMFGGGGIGGLLLGSLLFGRGGMGGFGNGYGYGGGVGAPATAAVTTDLLVQPAFQSLQNQIQTLSGQVNQNKISDEIGDLGGAVMSGIGSINDNVNSTTRDILSGQANIASAQQAANYTNLVNVNGLGRDITAQNNQNALQQLNSFNQLNTSTLQGFNNQQFQTAQATNQIIAQGTANAAAMAACCCEIKGVVTAEGNATRALINQLDKENLLAQLADAKGQVSNGNQTNALIAAMYQQTSTILQHLVPQNGNGNGNGNRS